MTNRGWFILYLGAALVGIGLVALNFPVLLDDYDRWGIQINCGTGYSTNLSPAQIAQGESPGTNFVDQCQGALASRRTWSGAVAAIGWAILSGLAVALWRHASTITEEADALTRP